MAGHRNLVDRSKASRPVKRWGSERGLPVHRVPGAAKTSVYAYPAELDRWLESAGAAEPDAEPDIEEKPEIAGGLVAVTDTALVDLRVQ
ncbi:MAG TPA: hypothetical protein VHD85_14090, partial [Terracidiphilus sp.]|nr:hypothetical protein [Terracidiphilus sp.]